MNVQTLKALAAARHLNQSDIAKAAMVSRQRVSQWFKSGDEFVNVRSRALHAIAKALRVDVDVLMDPMPLLDDQAALLRQTTALLWDRLYPNVVTLFVAALEGEKEAIARLVQVYGLHATSKMLGPSVWKDFQRYKQYIKPARRAGLEQLWQYRQSQMNA
jgi:transcriptional regulator with XRE-family HTH domain